MGKRKRKQGDKGSLPVRKASRQQRGPGEFVLFEKIWPVKIVRVQDGVYTVYSKSDDTFFNTTKIDYMETGDWKSIAEKLLRKKPKSHKLWVEDVKWAEGEQVEIPKEPTIDDPAGFQMSVKSATQDNIQYNTEQDVSGPPSNFIPSSVQSHASPQHSVDDGRKMKKGVHEKRTKTNIPKDNIQGVNMVSMGNDVSFRSNLSRFSSDLGRRDQEEESTDESIVTKHTEENSYDKDLNVDDIVAEDIDSETELELNTYLDNEGFSGAEQDDLDSDYHCDSGDANESTDSDVSEQELYKANDGAICEGNEDTSGFDGQYRVDVDTVRVDVDTALCCLSKLEEEYIERDKRHRDIYVRKQLKSYLTPTGIKKKTDRVHNNYHCCFLCRKHSTNILKHLLTHKDNNEIRELVELKKEIEDGNKDDNETKRKRHYVTNKQILLRCRGDHQHNMAVKKYGLGELMIARRQTRQFRLDDYGPCPLCLEWIRIDSYSQRHQKHCAKRRIDESTKKNKLTKGEAITQSAVLVGLVSEKASKNLIKEVYPVMTRDNISSMAKGDPLIVSLGNSWFQRSLSNKLKRKYYTSSRMRGAARLLSHLHDLSGEKLKMIEYIKPAYFDTMCEAALLCASVDSDDVEDLASPSAALKIGFDVGRLTQLKLGIAIREGSETMRKEAELFNCLMKMEWTMKVSKLAHLKLNQIKLSKTMPLPVPEDLALISRHLKSGLEKLDLNHCSISDTSTNYKRAIVLVQTRLLTYNKRRSGELEALSMENYQNRAVGLDEADTALLRNELTDLEKHLIESQQLIKIRGKNSKPVPILVPEDSVQALEYITSQNVRKTAGVKPWNKFVFANAGEGVYRAYDSLKTVCGELSLSAPERITSVSMRKYIATLSQVIDMKEHEMEWLCSHLGHTADIHKLHYRAQSGFIERVNIGKLMLLQDLNVAGKYAGKRLQDIDITEVVKGSSSSQREGTSSLREEESQNIGTLDEDLFDGTRKEISRFAKNFLPILFNLYTADTDKDKNPSRLAVFETIKSYFQITDKQLMSTYCDKCKDKLTEENITSQRKHCLYDLFVAMIPYLPSQQLEWMYNLALEHLQNTDQTLQKKCYRMLEDICAGKSPESRELVVQKLPDIQKKLLQSISASAPSSKAPRLRCIINVFKFLETENNKFLLASVPEAILCTKEVGERARMAAFSLLTEMGNAVIRWSDGEQGPLDEYFKMVMAGFAGSPQMISATLFSLTRIMFEFKEKMSSAVLQSIVENCCLLLKSKSREIVQSSLTFMKVLLKAYPVTVLAQYLQDIVKSLVSMKEDCHHHFRFKSKEIYSKLIKKFGYETIYGMVPESIRKVLMNIRKSQEREKRKKKGQEMEEESDEESPVFKSKIDSIEDILKDSDSEPENDQEEDKKKKKTKKEQREARAARKTGQSWLVEGGEDDIMDFMDIKASQKVTATKPVQKSSKKSDSGFKTAPDGRLIIADMKEDKGNSSDENIDELLEHLEQRREGRKIKQKKRKFEDLGDSDDDQPAASKYVAGGKGIHRPLKNNKQKPEDYGAEYRAKKAKGDVKKAGKPDPYAYVPLDFKHLNKRKQAKFKGRFKNLVKGAQRGAAKGKRTKRKQ